jgi:hypothetical protein
VRSPKRFVRCVISYHFAGKDDLIKQVVIDVVEAGRAYILPLVLEIAAIFEFATRNTH